jgi:ribose transport system permease protein
MDVRIEQPGSAKQVTVSPVDRIKALFQINEFVMLLVVLLLLFFSTLINNNMVSVSNLKLMTRDIAILGIAAIGVGFPIITGGIDLSVGSMIGLGGVMVALMMMNWQFPIVISIILTLGLGVVIGSIHGLFVTKLKMHGFLITLVSLGMARGAVLVITNAFPITGLPREFSFLGQGEIFGLIPVPVVIFVVFAAIAHFLLRYTYIGRQIYAVGGNIEAARYSGVNVDSRVILAYIISVVCAMTVGMIQAGRMSMGHPGTGEGFELLAIAACILGGYSLMGGEGRIWGIVIGAALIGVLQNAMVILQINPYWHRIVISTALAIAITIDYVRRRRR